MISIFVGKSVGSLRSIMLNCGQQRIYNLRYHADVNFTKSVLKNISLVVTNYNKKDFIQTFFQIAINAKKHGAEIIIVDDGSSDGSETDLAQFAAKYDLTYRRQNNRGSAAARNVCLNLASRSQIHFLDIDDEISIEKLAENSSILENDGSYMCIANYQINDRPVEFIDTKVLSRTKHQSHCGSEWLMYTKCFPRITYSNKFIKDYNLFFLPTFEELQNQFFILDDYFWLLHICAIHDIWENISFNDSILYTYRLPESKNGGISDSFANQAALFPDAILIFLKHLDECKHSHLNDILYKNLASSLIFHLKFLNLSQYLRAITTIIRNGYRFKEILKCRTLIKCVILITKQTFFRVLKNSIKKAIIRC